MKSDIEIAESVRLQPIEAIADKLGLAAEELEPYGRYKCKIGRAPQPRSENLVLVTAINPTPLGEGKTTTSIGLADGLARMGKRVCLALREPSLGPVFGVKGGATGGGMAQIAPMDEINLHFTGDLHAITCANNLISAILDNHLRQGNELRIDPTTVVWKRCMDMNDRQLRHIVCGLGGKTNGVPREDGFNITSASEIMAILCLAADLRDLKRRLGDILLAYTYDGLPVFCRDLGAADAAAIVLKDALKPNLVQTLEGTPAIVHGGPFANIAHGCNSVIATRTALSLADIVVTEAGFGADLGAEKFFDIKCRVAGLTPKAVVLVATLRALKFNGGAAKEAAGKPDAEALSRGMSNLLGHIENLRNVFGLCPVVAINRFSEDDPAELDALAGQCAYAGVPCALCECWGKGGEGALELADKVLKALERSDEFTYAYDTEASVEEKIAAVARRVYGAKDVEYTAKARAAIAQIRTLGRENLPICIAKTQYSFSDDAQKLGRPRDFTLHVQDVELRNGAGFIVAVCGNIMLMPGLSKKPAALGMSIDAETGTIRGLF